MRAAAFTYLFVLPWPLECVGGVNQVVINLARTMRQSGAVSPIVLINDWAATKPVWGETDGLTTVRWRIRAFHRHMGPKELIAFRLWSIRFRREFTNFCLQHQVAVVNPHYPDSAALALGRAVLRSSERPAFVVSFHGSDIESIGISDRCAVADWRSLLAQADSVVACSKALGERLVQVAGPGVKPQVIYNGVDPDIFASPLSRISSNERIVLSVGRFDHIKGQDVLVKAFARLVSDYTDLRLALVGVTGDKLAELKSLSSSEGVEELVTFYRDMPHDQVLALMKRASVFCLPSRREAFPVVILEAGACGLPVIASRVGGIPEILTEGETGRLAPPNDVAALANCLVGVLDSPSESRAMGERLRQLVTSRFTWTKACARYLTVAATRRAN